MSLSEEDKAYLIDLQRRRLEGFTAVSESEGVHTSKQYLAGLADVTTQDDIEKLNEILYSLPDDVRGFVRMYEDVWSEFTRGIRCSVCGRTPKQNHDIGYDCVREC